MLLLHGHWLEYIMRHKPLPPAVVVEEFGAGNEEDADGLAGKKGLATNGVLDNEMPPVVVPNMNT